MTHEDDVEWAAVEYGLQQVFISEQTDDGIVVHGTCPQCKHETRYPYPNVIDGIQEIKAVTMFCQCGHVHKVPDGAPADAKDEQGCGAFWTIPPPS